MNQFHASIWINIYMAQTRSVYKWGLDKDSLPQKKHKYRIKKMEILSGRDGGGGAKVSPVRLD